MFSKNLILAGILAAGLASADVLQHDATYSLTRTDGISSIRNLRAMTEQTALSAKAAQALLCDNIGSEGTELLDRAQLLDLSVILSLGAASAYECCTACVDNDLCVAFNFRPLVQVRACLLGGSRVDGQSGGLLNVAGLRIL